MLRVLARFTVVVCALFAAQAYALGLGDINVKSKLNQRFSATIPVLGASSAQLDSFTIRLASPEDFNRAGIERSDYLSSLKFNLEEVPGGAHVVVSSDQIAREPFLNFIVEARSPDGKLLREYTVLLDPPAITDNTAPAEAYSPPAAPVVPVTGSNSAPVSGPNIGSAHPDHLAPVEAAQLATQMPGAAKGKPAKAARAGKQPKQPAAAAAPAAVAETAPAPAAEAAPAASTGGGSTYGPTAPQETFWSIAAKLRPSPKVSMDQVLLAIYRANPSAFDKGSFNGLLKGRTLQVPSQGEMQETPPAQAKSLVDAWRHGSRPTDVKKNPEAVAATAATSPAPLPKPPKAAKSKPFQPAPELPPPAPAATPAPAPAAAKPAAVTPAPAAPVSAPTPAPAAAEPPKPATQVQSPAPAPATPAPVATAPAAETPPAAAPAPAEPSKPKPVPPPPPPSGGFLGDSNTLIGIILFAVLAIAGWWFLFRRRKEVMPDFGAKAPLATPASKKPAPAPKPAIPPPPPPATAKKPGPPGPPPMPKPQALRLGDTTALPDEPPAPVAPPLPKAPAPVTDFGRTQITEGPLGRTALNDTTRIKAGDTQAMAPPQRVLQESIPQATPPPIGGGDVDFDLTSQFEAQTLSINLDANDPLSEADFHLAYGLYDEAASLLKQALVKEPNRQDLRQKLAETYFAGGKPLEFQETAEALHGNISPAEWQKIAIMGRQLSPDASLFKGDGTIAAPDIDLSLGDSIGPAAMQVIGAAPAAKPGSNVIDFDFDSELMKAAPAAAKPTAAAPQVESKADFDLSQFDLSAEPTPAAGDHSIEFNLDELDLSKPSGSGHISSGDEIGTKLDLARVYADMGDNEAARGLLNEVLSTGNVAQKEEAEALIKRLSA